MAAAQAQLSAVSCFQLSASLEIVGLETREGNRPSSRAIGNKWGKFSLVLHQVLTSCYGAPSSV